MNTNGLLQKHWFYVALNFLIDAGLLCLAFFVAVTLRFGAEASAVIWTHGPAVLCGCAALSASIYICGLYTAQGISRGIFERCVVLIGCTLLATLVIIGASYIGVIRPLGRGAMALCGFTTYFLVVAHHVVILHSLRMARERVAYIVTSAFDEAETRLFDDFKTHNFKLLGVITACGYQPSGNLNVLGSIDDVAGIVKKYNLDRVLCTHKNLNNATLTRHFCQLRYSGVSVMPLIILCEEIQQQVPLELVTHEWLLSASGEPQLFYIKKVKRMFDILAAGAGLLIAAPLLGLAALAVKLTSPGPIFYRQIRSGRFGRTFAMTKLRTMRTDAEKDGIQWSSKDAKSDPRVTWIGGFLRRYRIDEIPQLWHVLAGDMSFVGPRPERPEIIKDLAKAIPFYEERLMIQPGITGWAQVCYPYGASILEARRKLEYDLYYMKHMSWFLDVFIMLDTVRIVLSGGVSKEYASKTLSHSGALPEWERLKQTDSQSGKPDSAIVDLGAA